MTDYQIEKILKLLSESPLTGYYIAQNTGLTEQTILNYRKKKTIPTNANAKLLEYFFNSHNTEQTSKLSKQSISGNNNENCQNIGSNNNDDIPAWVNVLLSEKDERIKEKDERIQELKEVIQDLKEIIRELKSK